MAINENNNKQENMVNNEQENYTGEQQEEGWFAKNKAVVIGVALFIAVLGIWAFSSGSNKPADAANAKDKSTSTAYFDKGWKYLDKAPSWKEIGAVGLGLVVLRWANKKWEVTKTIGGKFKGWWDASKNKVTGAGKEVPTN